MSDRDDHVVGYHVLDHAGRLVVFRAERDDPDAPVRRVLKARELFDAGRAHVLLRMRSARSIIR